MLNNKEKSFDRIYSESSKEANSLANEGIRELFFGTEQLVLSTPERLLLKISFQSIPKMLMIYGVVLLMLSISAFAAVSLKQSLGLWSDIIFAVSEIIGGIFVLVYTTLSVCLQDRAWLTVSLSERKELTADLVVEKWVARGQHIDDLMPAMKSSLDRLKKYQAFVKGVIITIGALITFFKIFLGDKFSIHDTVLAPLTGIFGYNPYIYATVFLMLLAGIFIRVIAPIMWRESLEPVLGRAIERYKREQI